MKHKIAVQNSHPHATRDARFAEMGRGDITGWQRKTNAFVRPEVKGRGLAPALVVEDLAALRSSPLQMLARAVEAHVAGEVVLVAPQNKADGVTQAIKSCEKAIEAFGYRYRMQKAQAEVAMALKEGRPMTVKEYA